MYAKSTLVFLALASTAVAAPGYHNYHHHKHHHHHTGTGTGGVVSSTPGPYGMSNSTYAGPTGTGTAPPVIIYSTVIMSPVPPIATLESSDVAAAPASSTAVELVGSVGAGTCGPATVTVTASNVVTVTVGGDSSSSVAAASSIVAPYTIGNSTETYGATGTGYGTGTAYSSYYVSSTAAAAAAPSSEAASSAPGTFLQQPTYTKHHFTSPMVPMSSSTEAALPVSSTEAALPTSTSIYVPESTSSSSAYYSPPPPETTSTSAAAISVPASTSEAPTPTSTSGSGSGSGSYSGPKRGLVYNTASLLAPLAESTSVVGWAYNWASTSGGLDTSLNFVPQLWGSSIGSWSSQAATAVKSGADSLLAFNEPDQPTKYGGSQIDPQTAASLYKTNMAPFSGQAQLGAPAVSNGNQTTPTLMGVQWLKQFFDSCSGSSCPIDFIPFHWYGWNGGTAQQQATAFQDYVTAFASEVGAMSGVNKFWITEFAAQPDTDAQLNADFMDIVLPWLDSQASMIDRYSYFMASDGILLSGSGLSAAGEAYIKAT
ncbi:hypothetical protein MMC25_003765 [Agyrium rufum]|nr:hypothetical protein [Agyrium rufum]